MWLCGCVAGSMETKGIITSEMPLDFIKPRDYLDSTEFEIIPLDHLITNTP